MIKKCFLMTALCLSVLAIILSCNKPDQPKEPETIADKIELESRNLTCSPNATTLTTTVTTANGITSVESSNDWCKVSFDKATVTLDVAENASVMSRDATITVVSGTESAKIALNQDGVVIDFPLSGQAISTNDEAKDTVVTFTTNADFVFSSSVDWASAEKSDDGMKISLQENTTGTIRTGTVYMTFGEIKDSVYVTQSDFVGVCGNMHFYYGFWFPGDFIDGGPVTLTNDKMTVEKIWDGDDNMAFNGPFSFPIKLKGDEQGHYVATIESGSFLGYFDKANSFSFFLSFPYDTGIMSGQSMDIVFTKEKDANGEEIMVGRFPSTIYESNDPSITYDLGDYTGLAFLFCWGETDYPNNFTGQLYPIWCPLITSKELDEVEYYDLMGFE